MRMRKETLVQWLLSVVYLCSSHSRGVGAQDGDLATSFLSGEMNVRKR